MSDNSAEHFERIRVPSAYEMVAEAIEAEIVSGRLRPGDEIGTEAALVRQFGVNRSTVREGIRVLEQGGLVRREAGRKLFVCEPRYGALSSRMSRVLVLQDVTFRELYDAALILEVGAVEGATAHADHDDIEALEANQTRLEAAIGNPVRVSEIDTEFHALVARASRNRVLELAREPAALLFFPTSEMICRRVPEGAARMAQAHRSIIDAVKARDLDLARTWMARHLADWRKGFVRAGREIDEPVERIFARYALSKSAT
ncbi:FadR family transcriptional regulator [Xanthobacter dioxanivorans]|uniref:FadR family transcriptional regulator n=1 Tax=Xanthobacter dioxanivorans TaxID=2528964 RepID=A0A974SJS9_9HYPH|nr:FCD domain-containing protein [Xanthobacter dioxanivorans]QRG07792.1 FadR family transcriptional regulator [Xanthobacter dioxanivorans]